MAFDPKRRMFLRGGAGALATGLGIGRAQASVNARSLTFDNIHTGEKLAVTYWEGGRYLPDALANVDHILRDFRNGEIHSIDPRLLDLLTKLHQTVGSAAPFQIISGYRSPQTNSALRNESHNVALKSFHMKGMAVDIRLADRSTTELHGAAKLLKAGGVGFYPGPDFVHVDVGPIRYW